ncbi:MAG TPA: S1 RNA-binding domain-containing protein, partial [Anaeromyxobacteraceae bacterium]|nr:S1 RNA-binding domain-containing protein [Anaeromyxobacteraceae bacterium]
MENQTSRTPEGEVEDFAAMFAESEAKAGPVEEGKVVSGTVIQVAKDFVVIDIGYKSEGQVPLNEFIPAPGGEPAVKVGDRVEVLVESRENDTGMVVLSKEKADKMRIWDEISAACERDELVEGIIV